MTPKQRFLESTLRKTLETWAMTRDAEITCDTALAQFVTEQLPAVDMNEAAANQYRTEGAKRVLQILLDLHKPVEESKREPIARRNLQPPK
jgi:hypothetical protein